MQALPHLTTSLLLFFATVTTLTAQEAGDHPNQVNGPVTKADPGFFDTPFLWIALVVFGLAVLLIFLRRGKSATYGRKHVERSSGTRQ